MATTTATTTSSGRYGRAFWELLWRTAGIQFVGLLIVGWVLYGLQPGVGASAETVDSFYTGNATRILIGASVFGLAMLNLMWFAAALRSALADAEQDGWGAAATASSSAVAVLFLIMGGIVASIATSASTGGLGPLASGLNRFLWAAFVLSSFPRAMLIMAGSLGLWRAGRISNGMFTLGVACIVLTLIGGTTWLDSGFWAVDGAYSRFFSPMIGLVWVLVASAVLLKTAPAQSGW